MTKAAYTDVLNYKDFESGWGNYTDCERDCRPYTGGTHAHKGISAANIKNNSGTSSTFYHTNGIDVHMSGYTKVTVDFWFKAVRSFVETKWLFFRKNDYFEKKIAILKRNGYFEKKCLNNEIFLA